MEIAIADTLIQREVIGMNKALLKEELLKSPFIELATTKLDPTDEIIIVLLTGSTAAGISHERSDLDIAILTKKSWDLQPDYRGEFQGKPLHWWITPYDFGLKSWAYPIYLQLLLVGNYYMSFDDPENIIYLNPKYEKLIEFFKETKKEIQFLSLYLLTECFKIREYNIWKKWEKFSVQKTVTPLLDFYYKQNNLSLNIELIKKIKQLRDYKLKLSDEEQAEVRKALLWTCDYFRNLEDNYAMYWAQWSIKAQAVLKECQKEN